MITFSPTRFDDQMLLRYEALFVACFSEAEKFSPAVLKWLYADNPEGHVVGFDAFDGDELAAHYVCIPTTVRINGEPVRALLSLNTATHPRFQGKGLFSKLAEMTYHAAAEQGYYCIYGVANANSTPGFVRKLGFQLIQPLDAMIGIGGLGVDFGHVSRNAQFERVWTLASLQWRCANPANRVSGFRRLNVDAFHASAFGRAMPVYGELLKFGALPCLESRPLTPLRLYLGLVPAQSCRFSTYASIPQRLRPSPLNLIFRPLANSTLRLDAGHIFFSFLDFDAY